MDIKERLGESEEDTKIQEVVGTTASGSDFTKHQYYGPSLSSDSEASNSFSNRRRNRNERNDVIDR